MAEMSLQELIQWFINNGTPKPTVVTRVDYFPTGGVIVNHTLVFERVGSPKFDGPDYEFLSDSWNRYVGQVHLIQINPTVALLEMKQRGMLLNLPVNEQLGSKRFIGDEKTADTSVESKQRVIRGL
jgi:hypothetical protein